MFASRLRSLSSAKRSLWNGSRAKERTTRMPESVSWRSAVIDPIVSRVWR